MPKFEKTWSRQETPSVAGKIRDACRPQGALKPRIQNAVNKLQVQTSKMDSMLTKLRERDAQIFQRIVIAMQQHDTTASRVLSNELAEIRKVTNKKICQKIIKKTLSDVLIKNNIDVATLSSTHLPLLRSILQEEFPEITFLDPAQEVANKVKNLRKKRSNKNSLRIFTSGNTETFQKQLMKIGIKNKVNSLSLP